MSSATAWMPLSDDCGLCRDEKFPAYLRPVAEFRVPQIRRPRDGCFPGGGRYAAVRSGRRLPPPAASLGRHVCAAGVAQHGLRALFRGRGSCIPGVFTKICVCVCRLVPAWLMRCVLRIPAVARLFLGQQGADVVDVGE